jgi:hypothetical protein
MYGLPLSPEAQKAQEEAAMRWRLRKDRAERQRARMQRGPRLEGPWLVIPSDWYNEDAKDFWKSLGAFWIPSDPEPKTWVIDTRKPYKGKRYTRWAWLQSIRRKFGDFYPELEGCDD